MGSFARLDPPLAGVRREVGPLLLAWHFIAQLDLIGTSIGRCRRAGVSSCRSGRRSRPCAAAGCAPLRRCMTSRGGRPGRRCRSCSGSRRAVERRPVRAGAGDPRGVRGDVAWDLGRPRDRDLRDRRRPVARRSDRSARVWRVRELGVGCEWVGARAGRRSPGPCVAGSDRGRRLVVRAPGAGQRGRGVTDRAEPRATQSAVEAGRVADPRLRVRAPQDAVRDRALRPVVHRAVACSDRVPGAVPGRRRPGRAASAAVRLSTRSESSRPSSARRIAGRSGSGR